MLKKIKKLELILDLLLAIIMAISTIYCLVQGFSNRDSYFLLVGLLDFIIVQFSLRNAEYDVDNMNEE